MELKNKKPKRKEHKQTATVTLIANVISAYAQKPPPLSLEQ